MDLVEKNIKAFKVDLLISKVPQNFRDLEKIMTPRRSSAEKT